MSIQARINHACKGISLLKQSQRAFRHSYEGNDHDALNTINSAKKRYGTLTQYKFGIEMVLLEIFTKGTYLASESQNATGEGWTMS